MFAVYDRADELRLRAHIDAFATAATATGYTWTLVDLTDEFPRWLASQEYRDAYFESPGELAGYPVGQIEGFADHLGDVITTTLKTHSGPNDVVALLGVGALFGLARVSTLVESIKHDIGGRLLVLFPGEYHPNDNSYRLLGARDGWNYLAHPLVVTE